MGNKLFGGFLKCSIFKVQYSKNDQPKNLLAYRITSTLFLPDLLFSIY
jgi:hypothetical protein